MAGKFKVGDVVWTSLPIIESKWYGDGQLVYPRQMKIVEIEPHEIRACYFCEETGEPDTDSNASVEGQEEEFYSDERLALESYLRIIRQNIETLNREVNDVTKRITELQGSKKS